MPDPVMLFQAFQLYGHGPVAIDQAFGFLCHDPCPFSIVPGSSEVSHELVDLHDIIPICVAVATSVLSTLKSRCRQMMAVASCS